MVNVSIRCVARRYIYPAIQDAPSALKGFRGTWEVCFGQAVGPVAQLGERLVCIQEVVGSNPVRSTIVRAYSSVWLERTPDKREVGGSNPPRPTSYEVL